MKTLAIIPARSGSKGLPGKNLKKLGDKHLFELSVLCSMSANVEYVISTDDDQIIEICDRKGYSYLRRPVELAQDTTPMVDVVKHTASCYPNYDAYMILQPTSPFRKGTDITQAISILADNDDLDSVVSLSELEHKFHPSKVMKIEGKYARGGMSFINRQELKETNYFRNGLVYLARSENLISGFITGNVGYFITESERALDIDKQQDLDYAQFLLSAKNIF